MNTDQVHALVPIRSFTWANTHTYGSSPLYGEAHGYGSIAHLLRTSHYMCTPCRTFRATCANVYDRSRHWFTDQEKANTQHVGMLATDREMVYVVRKL